MPDFYPQIAQLTETLSDGKFVEKLLALYGDVVYKTLFGDCTTVGLLLKGGFYSLVDTVKLSTTMTERQKKGVLANMFKDVSIKAMSAFFSAHHGITSKDFLSRVIYSGTCPSPLKQRFEEAVRGFSPIETYRLYRFITDEKYNSGTICHVKFNLEGDVASLPTASTCFQSISIPAYPNIEIMRSKLTLATFSTAYGCV